MGLGLLPTALLDPCHFHFDGNRHYAMQLATNGVSCGLISHQASDPDAPADEVGYPNPPWDTLHLEVIQAANLPFLTVRPPTPEALLELAEDWVASRVEGFHRLPLSESQRAFHLRRAVPMDARDAATYAAILAGAHPKTVRTWNTTGSYGAAGD